MATVGTGSSSSSSSSVDWGSLASSLAGAYAGYKDNQSKSSTTGYTLPLTGYTGSLTNSSSNTPDYMMPYLTGSNGIYPLTEAQYNANMEQGYLGQTEEQAALNAQSSAALGQQYGTGRLGEQMSQAGAFANQYGVKDTATTSPEAMAAMGSLDPTNSLQGILAGNIDTKGLDALQQAATNRANIGYQDRVDDAATSFTQKIAPSIRSGAQLSGQYGGTRQGIAEGIAAGELNKQLARDNRDLTTASMDVGTQLYGNAYQQANEQKYGAATGLSAQGTQSAQVADMYGMQANLANAGLQQTGYGLEDAAMQRYLASQDKQYGYAQTGVIDQQAGQQFGWDQLANYIKSVQAEGKDSVSKTQSSGRSYTPVTDTATTSNLTAAVTGAAAASNAYSVAKT